MGSRVSCHETDEPLNSVTGSTSSTNDVLTKTKPDPKNQKSTDKAARSDVYINDKFRLEFLDCDCCCDTTKKVANCDFQGLHVLQDLYEMVVTPEYKLNCRCSCGDDNSDKKQTIKFGLTGFPNAQLTCDGSEASCPTSSDSRK